MGIGSVMLICLIIGIGSGIAWGCATAAVRNKKGYGRNWFWFGFFLGLVPFIIACAIPARRENPNKVQLTGESYARGIVARGGWMCSCGRAHPAYVSTCTCGRNKQKNVLPAAGITPEEGKEQTVKAD